MTRLHLLLFAWLPLTALSFVPALLFGQALIRPAGGGFGNMHFGLDCNLGQVYDAGTDALLFRLMDESGEWSESETIEQGIAPGGAAIFQVNRGEGNRWEAIYVSRYTTLRHAVRSDSGEWQLSTETQVVSGVFFERPMLAVHLDDGGVYHMAFLSAGGLLGEDSVPKLIYVRLDDGVWTQEELSTFSGRTLMEGFDSPHNFDPPRMLSLAADPAERVHVVFSAEQTSTPVSGGTLVRSDLFYYQRKNGSWSGRQVLVSGGSSDDAGLGASLAVAPDGTVAVASTYLPRAGTGSPGRASLLYSVLQGDGSWQTETVANTSDGYRSGDGERGTGLSPYLQFDSQSRPHILCNDHASEHAQGTAFSYAGQVRYATREAPQSGSWALQTLVEQPTGDAFLRRASPPVLALGGSGCAGVSAFFAEHFEFDEPNFEWNYFNFFQVEGDLGAAVPWYASAVELDEGWRWFGWFKSFKPVEAGWVYHAHHGWFYVIGEDPSRLFLWDGALNRWLFTSESLYPWLYAFGPDGGWVWFFENGSPGARFFARGSNGQIISEEDFGL